jgi:hypothetical protein
MTWAKSSLCGEQIPEINLLYHFRLYRNDLTAEGAEREEREERDE